MIEYDFMERRGRSPCLSYALLIERMIAAALERPAAVQLRLAVTHDKKHIRVPPTASV